MSMLNSRTRRMNKILVRVGGREEESKERGGNYRARSETQVPTPG